MKEWSTTSEKEKTEGKDCDCGEVEALPSSALSSLAAKFGVTVKQVETVVSHEGLEQLKKIGVIEFLDYRKTLVLG